MSDKGLGVDLEAQQIVDKAMAGVNVGLSGGLLLSGRACPDCRRGQTGTPSLPQSWGSCEWIHVLSGVGLQPILTGVSCACSRQE